MVVAVAMPVIVAVMSVVVRVVVLRVLVLPVGMIVMPVLGVMPVVVMGVLRCHPYSVTQPERIAP